MRVAGIVHTPAATSSSRHSAPRTSPERPVVSTRNSNASLTTGRARDPRTAATADATPRCGRAGMCRVRCCWRPSTRSMRPHGLLVRYSIATAHSITRPMRWSNRRAVVGRSCQMCRSVSTHVGAAHLRHRLPADVGEGEAGDAGHPVAAVLGVAPAGAHLVPDALGGGGEGRGGGGALLGHGVAAGAGELAVGEGLGAGLLERDEGKAAEADLAPPAVDGEPLHPAAAARRLDLQVQALAVAVAAGPGDAVYEVGRQGVLGMPPARFRLLLLFCVQQ